MKVSDEIEVYIEKMSNLGFGIAKLTEHGGLVVFVENACPGDRLKVKITKLNKSWASASVVEILKPSEHRVEPFCAMQKVCGGCQLQFIDYDYQLELKKQIVEDAIRGIGGIDTKINDVMPSPENKNYRHKVQYPISQTKVSKRILAGYYKPKSHEIVNIKHCPIQPEICDTIIEFIRNKAFDFGISGYNEKKHAGDLRHVVLRVSKATDKVLVVLVVNSSKVFDRLKDFAQDIYDNFKEVSGVCANFNSQKTNVILGANSELIVGKDFVKERILDKTFRIGPNTFFQVNPKSAENIFAYVKDYIQNNLTEGLSKPDLNCESRMGLPSQQQESSEPLKALPTVLDAYAGVTSFGICVSDVCKKVVSVEENKEAVEFAQAAIEANDVKNVELHNMDAQKFFEKMLKIRPDAPPPQPSPSRGAGVYHRKFDAVILDPPRKGCTKESLDYAMQLSKSKIIYVSCNPATLARDLKYLTEKGAKVESIQPFDMFCHTYHVENVAVININY